MKVKTLLKKLQDMPLDMEVVIGDAGEPLRGLKEVALGHSLYKGKTDTFVLFIFKKRSK